MREKGVHDMSITEGRDLRNSVVYQIYVKSFCDSDGDGVGDLPGITSKLDYLANLGVDYLWLTPFYPSPQRDNGYDISDYCAVDSRYGTMEDFDELVREANRRGIKLMLDMVLCHTSVEHEWFRRACAGEEAYRQYYILRDGRNAKGAGDPGEPPTNWQCVFGGSAWEWEPSLGKWYLHMHDPSQPDLNWDNPQVRKEMARVVRFWKDRGVEGFRFDVVNLISKPAVIEDVPGDGSACRKLVADGPHVHEYLKELVERAGIGDMLTVGEMASTDLANCIRYSNPRERKLSETFSFHHLKVDYKDGKKWSIMEPDISELRRLLAEWQEQMQAGGGCNAIFWDNHDQPRAITRFGGRGRVGERGGSWERVGKMLAICLFGMRGTPYIYQGDELGMTNAGYTRIEQFDDVESHNNYRILREGGSTSEEALFAIGERSRDNGRTPMQWTPGAHAGFTTGTPWLSMPDNHALINVEAEVGVDGSMFEFYRALVKKRHELDVLNDGAVSFLDAGEQAPKVIAFERTLGDERVVALCSFDEEACRVDAAGLGLFMTGDLSEHVLVANYEGAPAVVQGALPLRPYEAVLLRA